MLFEPTVSIIINTNGRRESLARTLQSLRFLEYRNFEVCVVCGPTSDGTREMVASWPDPIRRAECEVHNLSVSRNIGIDMAAGEIVAFIDDDAIPEPEWLSDVVAAFADTRVGGSGGIVLDNTGVAVQHQFVVVDRLARADLSRWAPADELDYPFTYHFPHLTGTNCAFRRAALTEIGGFDEEFEYFLDETDVCLRMHDAAWIIRHVSRGRLHHKFAPSNIRDKNRVTNPFPILKNKIYFCLKHGQSYHGMADIMSECVSFSGYLAAELRAHHAENRITAEKLAFYLREIDRAWAVGLAQGMSGQPRMSTRAGVAPSHFRPFSPQLTAHRKTFAFLSQSYAPMPPNGVSRYVTNIARALADRGHHVHVLTDGTGSETLDFEDGVWVHRLQPTRGGRSIPADGRRPESIWLRAGRYADALIAIDGLRRIDVVEAPSWDAEALGVIAGGLLPVLVNVVTTMAHYLDGHPEFKDDPAWMAAYGEPIQIAERSVFQGATGLICASRAIRDELLSRYEVGADIPIVMCPHGLRDPINNPQRRPGNLAQGDVNILFVGRLEERKAPELLIAAGIQLLAAAEQGVVFWLAGEGSQVLHDGQTALAYYQGLVPLSLRERFQFLGAVPDEELCWLYAHCDILAAPSRFESFGLMAVEAMAFSKPVVASQMGGLGEIVLHGETGLSVGASAVELERALQDLLNDDAKRCRFGEQGRRRFEQHYVIESVARLREEILSRVQRQTVDLYSGSATGGLESIAAPFGGTLHKLHPGTSLSLTLPAGRYVVSFWRHRWSGNVVIRSGDTSEEIKLWSEEEGLHAVHRQSRQPFSLEIANVSEGGGEVLIQKVERQQLGAAE